MVASWLWSKFCGKAYKNKKIAGNARFLKKILEFNL